MKSAFKTGLFFSAAITLMPVAVAQTTSDAEMRQETVTVTATPIRDSQVAAIEAKKNADNVVDVLAADTIGRFPDQNLADSLARVPGLAVERDQGQARYETSAALLSATRKSLLTASTFWAPKMAAHRVLMRSHP